MNSRTKFFSVLTGITAICLAAGLTTGMWYAMAGITLSTATLAIVWRKINKIRSGYTNTTLKITEQLQDLDKTNRNGMVMVDTINELAGLVSAINSHLTKEKDTSESSIYKIRELKISKDTAEVELRHLKSVIFSIAEGVVITDQNGNLVLANRKAQEIFGFIFDNSSPEPIEDIIHNKDIISMVTEGNYRKNDYIELSRQVEIKGSDTISRTYKLVCWPVYDSLDSKIGQVIVSYDITTEHDIQLMKDDIISSISHELKTPLTAIRAYAEMLANKEYDQNDTLEEMASIIQNQANRMTEMIDDILYLSRIENNAVMLTPQPFNINKLMDEIIMTIRPAARENNVELEKCYAADQIECTADNILLYHAVINIVANAVKYSKPNGKVTIETEDRETMVLIKITDTGIGIPQDHINRIFDKFYRVPGKHNVKGTGLGLNLSKRVVEEIHKGFITVNSQEDQGSTFTISLPKTFSEVKEVVQAG